MGAELSYAVVAAPLLAGSGLRVFLVVAVVAMVIVTIIALRTGRRRSPNHAPPMTKPRLVPRDKDDPES